MKIRVYAERLVSTGNFSNVKFGCELEFVTTEPKTHGDIQQSYRNAYRIVNAEIEQQIAAWQGKPAATLLNQPFPPDESLPF